MIRALLCLFVVGGCTGTIGEGGGTGGGVDGIDVTDLPPLATCDDSYEAVEPWTYGSKVKNLLTGLALTGEELAALNTNRDALRGQIEEWLDTEVANDKMVQFFGTMFQQDGFENQALTDRFGFAIIQLGNYPDFDFVEGGSGPYRTSLESIFFRTFQESFARMAHEIYSEGRRFDEVLTTQDIYLTTAQIIALTVQDNHERSDDGEISWRTRGLPAVVYQDTNPEVTLARSLDPEDPEFLHFYVGGRAPGDVVRLDACNGRFENNPNVPQNMVAWLALNGFFITPMGSCRHSSVNPGEPRVTQDHEPLLELTDYFDFRKVRIRQPDAAAGEVPNEFWEVEHLRALGQAAGAGNELLLQIPRVGFFTTPAFFATWPTNQDNEARVTANQALIVALGESFDDSDMTVPINDEALSEEHAGPGTGCYACHVNLDPMRQYFRRSYSYAYSTQTVPPAGEPDPFDVRLPPSFGFRGHQDIGEDIFDLAETLTEHPYFAPAMVQKVCYYATSTECPEHSPEFVEIVDAFREHLNFRQMMVDVLSSPLVTGSRCVEGGAGDVPSISRRRHFCLAMNQRLGVGTGAGRSDICGDSYFFRERLQWGLMRSLVAIVADDTYSRGDSAPITITEPSLFTTKAAEAVCAGIAQEVINTHERARFSSEADLDAAIEAWTSELLGLAPGDPRREATMDALHRHYAAARAGNMADGGDWRGANEIVALQSTFVSACMSSGNLAMGL